MWNVFISYDRESRDLAEALAEDIQALGHVVWLDRELAGGHPWWDRILEQIRLSDVFAYVLTPRSLDSVACQREHSYAAALGKTVIPILAAEEISTNLLPPALAQLQFVDYRSRDRAAALRLARAFGAVPPPVPLPNPLPAAPEAPISYLGGVAHRLSATPVLNQEEQSVLFIDLKARLRDPETAEDARSLLKQFRERRELLASIAFEIDAVLGAEQPASRRQTQREEHAPPIIAGKAEVAEVSPKSILVYMKPILVYMKQILFYMKPILFYMIDRLYPALAGAFLGFVITAVAAIGGKANPPWELRSFLLPCVGGAVAGVMAGRRRMVALCAVVGAVVTWIVVGQVMHSDNRSLSDAFFAGGMVGAPLGAILGAIAGLIYRGLRRYR